MRILCLFFPRLGLQLAVRQRPMLEGRALVMLQGHGEDALVTSATADASARGLLAGMTAAEARRRIPEARFLADNAGDCLDELERLADIIRRRATPLVEIAARDHLFIDIGTLAEGPREESSIAGTLARLATTWTECTVRTGVASSRREALEAARAARKLAAVCPPASLSFEAPIAPHRAEIIAATVSAESDSLLPAKLTRTLRYLDGILAARGASVRAVDIVVPDPAGDRRMSLRLRQPVTSTEVVATALLEVSTMVAGATAVRIELSRLGPDVRVRPCIASVAHRPVQRYRSRREVLLRAG